MGGQRRQLQKRPARMLTIWVDWWASLLLKPLNVTNSLQDRADAPLILSSGSIDIETEHGGIQNLKNLEQAFGFWLGTLNGLPNSILALGCVVSHVCPSVQTEAHKFLYFVTYCWFMVYLAVCQQTINMHSHVTCFISEKCLVLVFDLRMAKTCFVGFVDMNVRKN